MFIMFHSKKGSKFALKIKLPHTKAKKLKIRYI